MGNRAIIIANVPAEKPVVGIYVHWNGGIDSVLAFLEVCKQRGYADPENDDEYAMARLCGVIHEFFGIESSSSLGLCTVTKKYYESVVGENKYDLDNGIYVVGKNWTVAEHRGGFCGSKTTVEELDEDELKQYKGMTEHILSGKLVHADEEEK